MRAPTRVATPLLLLVVGAAGARGAEYSLAPDPVQGDYTLACDVPSPATWPAGAEVRIAFDRQSEATYHVAVLTPEGGWFEEVAGAESRRLTHSGTWPKLQGTVAVSVRRRAWAMELLCNGRSVARAHDAAPYGGHVGVLADGVTLGPDDVVVQLVEPVRFSDDFMRGPGEAELWRVASGQWRNVGLAGGKGELRPELSANPFSLCCNGPGPQLTTVGDWFWDSYSASVAVKAALPDGTIGLAFGVQDAANYYLLALGRASGATSPQMRLERVLDGQAQVLETAAGGYEPDLWSLLTARTSNGLIEGWLDGEQRIGVYDPTFGEGGIGLFAQDAGDGWFDDVIVEPWEAFTDPFTAPGLSAWLQTGGRWDAGDGSLHGTGSAEQGAGLMTGPPSWTNYEVAADVVVGEAEGVGLYACVEGLDNWYLFYWARGAPVGTWHLMRMVGGRPTVLATAAGDLDPGATQRLSLGVGHGLLDGRVDGRPVLAAADFARTTGGAGLRADGGQGVVFRNVMVRSLEEPYLPVEITAQFAKEDTMADWARPASDWPRDPQSGAYVFRLPVFGDVSLRAPFRQAVNAASRVALRIAGVAEEELTATGVPLAPPVVEVEYVHGGAGRAAVTARRGGLVLGQAEVGAAPEHSLRVDKVGTTLRAWLDGAPVLAVNDATWLDNSGLDLASDGAYLDLNRVETYSTHLREYTFAGAPTDWRPTLGVWQVTDRWSCFPGWAWFGGSKHKSPLVWSKRQFWGDQTFEFWAGLEMDTTPERGGYTHPSDINCTIAGDGQNLCSGYSFVFAGDNNTKTKILRGNAVVAETNAVRLVNPNTGNFDFHRHWFHVRVVKLGPELFMAVDGQWVLRWQDPQPLAGGHVAIWSYNNGILVARARASAQIVR